MVRGKEGRPARWKRPITPTILRHLLTLKGDVALNGTDWEMLWGICCTAFFGFFRLGELLAPSAKAFDPAYHLNLADLSANHKSDPSVIHLQIKASKTDPFHRGVTVVLGKTGKDLCPVKALLNYLRVRGIDSSCNELFISRRVRE